MALLPALPVARAHSPPTSEQAIDERRQGRAFGRDQNDPEHQQKQDNGREPPLLAHFQEAPELFDYAQFAHIAAPSTRAQLRTFVSIRWRTPKRWPESAGQVKGFSLLGALRAPKGEMTKARMANVQGSPNRLDRGFWANFAFGRSQIRLGWFLK